MTLSDWTLQLYDELRKRIAQHVEPEPDDRPFERTTRTPGAQPTQGGCFHVDLGRYGLHIMPDDGDVLVWLLDAEGRTNGPIWFGSMTTQSTSTAAVEVVKVVKGAPPAAAFTAWPPTRRDYAREDAANALWALVRERIDQVKVSLRDEADVKVAITAVEGYIDELARLDEGTAIAEFTDPFKAEAARAIRCVADR